MPEALNLASDRNSPVHSSIGTLSPSYGARTACKHTVSGSISLRLRGAFHLSLTVLVRYRSPGVFSLGGWSPRIPTGFLVPRGTWDPPVSFRLSPTGLLPTVAGLSRPVRLGFQNHVLASRNPAPGCPETV